MTFCGSHLWCRWSLFCHHCEKVTISPRSTTLLLQSGILQMTDVHQWCELHFHTLVSCFIDHVRFVPDPRQIPSRNFLKFLLFVVHCCFCCRYFHCQRHGDKFVPRCNNANANFDLWSLSFLPRVARTWYSPVQKAWQERLVLPTFPVHSWSCPWISFPQDRWNK